MPFALQSLKKWDIQSRNPTLQFKQPATWEIFATKLKKCGIHMMSQEIMNFNQEKYEVLNYKNENSLNLWQKYHKSHQSKQVCFFGFPKLEQLLSMEANHHRAAKTQDFLQRILLSKPNSWKLQWPKMGANGSKSKRESKRMRDCNPNEEGKPP